MTTKILEAILTVVLGIGGSLVLYWVLNFLVERLPGKAEERVKPYVYLLPAYAAIGFFLIYPAILTIINSFKDSNSVNWVGFDNYHKLLTSHEFQQTLINTLLWIILVPAATVVVG